MSRFFRRPLSLAIILFVATFIPIASAPVRMFQILTDQLPADAIKFTTVPWALFLHALGGLAFGLAGPLQFARALKLRFGSLHKVTGHVFVIAGSFLALSSLRLLFEFPHDSTWVLVCARAAAALGMILAMTLALIAVRNGNFAKHRAWMIRTYALGMGAATISFIQLPIFLTRGEALQGYFADSLFVLSWVINLTFAEIIIQHIRSRALKPQLDNSDTPIVVAPHSISKASHSA
jgi:uncharacterized membrane protein